MKNNCVCVCGSFQWRCPVGRIIELVYSRNSLCVCQMNGNGDVFVEFDRVTQ